MNQQATAPAPENLATGPHRLSSWLMLAVIVGGGVYLRCHGMASRSLWFDEAFSYWVSQFPLDELFNRVSNSDNHPPLHYLMLHFWIEIFGNSLAALRSLGVLLGGLTIVGSYLFTVEALSGGAENDRQNAAPARETGLWVAALVALSLMQIRWSWDVRMYSLGATLTAFSSWALFVALHSARGRLLPWLGYAVLALMLAYTHYFGLFTVAAQGLFVAGYLLASARRFGGFSGQPSFRGAVLAGTVICLGWLPWLPFFLRQHSKFPADFWVPPVSWRNASAMAYHVMIEPESYVPDHEMWMATICAHLCWIVPLALVLRPLISVFGNKTAAPMPNADKGGPAPAYCYSACAATVPIGLCLLASAVGLRLFYSRYFLFAHLFFLVSLGLLLGSVRSAWIRRGAGTLLLLLLLWLHMRFMDKIDLDNNPSYSGVVKYIESQRQPGEPVVVCSQMLYLPLLYHSAGAPGWYQFGKDTNPDGLDAWTAMGAKNVMDSRGLRAVTARFVWVVDASGDSLDSRVPVPPQWILRERKPFLDTYNARTENWVLKYETTSEDRSKK